MRNDPTGAAPDTELEVLVDEVRLLFHQCARIGDEIHAEAPVTMAMRAVLEFLDRHGPTSVPVIAKSRHVSRQHIQVLADELREQGLVRLAANPAHKRSKLVALTAAGRRLFAAMRKRERAVLDAAAAELKVTRLRRAIGVLRDLRTALERHRLRTREQTP